MHVLDAVAQHDQALFSAEQIVKIAVNEIGRIGDHALMPFFGAFPVERGAVCELYADILRPCFGEDFAERALRALFHQYFVYRFLRFQQL